MATKHQHGKLDVEQNDGILALFVHFNAEIHFPLDGLFEWIDFLQDLCHCFDQFFAGDTRFFILEFSQKLSRGHWFAHQITSDCFFGDAIITEKMKKEKINLCCSLSSSNRILTLSTR